MISSVLLANIVGAIAFLGGLYALSQKSDVVLRIMSCTGAFLWSLHFWLLDAPTASVLAIVIGIRLLVAYKLMESPRRIKQVLMLLFQIIHLVVLYLTWKGIPSIAVWLAASLATYGFFMWHGPRLRQILIVVDALWLVHDYLTNSFVHAIATAVQIGLNIRMTKKMLDDRNANLPNS